MAISYVSNQESYTIGPSSPITISTNIGTRTNGLLVVGISGPTSAPLSSMSLTYAGDSMSLATSHVDSGKRHARLYYLANPTNGTNDLVVTYSVASGGNFFDIYILSSWYDGVNQTQASVLDQVNDGEGTTDPSLDITPTENNELIVSQYLSEANDVLTVGSGETLINDYDAGGRVYGGSYAIQTTATTQTVDFSGVDDNWVMVVGSFKASGRRRVYVAKFII